jgi:cell wall-associated protease
MDALTPCRFKNLNRTAIRLLLITLFVAPFYKSAQGQTLSKAQMWQLLDYSRDSVYGTSVNRAYDELLKGKKSHPVIVAVIDEGVDITHEDLQGHIWTNAKEVPGNHLDDDKNGYVDDIHGWNFLGGKDGRNIYANSSEADREYARLLPEFAGKDSVQAAKMKGYTYFRAVKKEHIEDSVGRNEDYTPGIIEIVKLLSKTDSLVKKQTGKPATYKNDLAAFTSKDSAEMKMVNTAITFYMGGPFKGSSAAVDSIVRYAMVAIADQKEELALQKQVNPSDPLALRRDIVKDNPADINDRYYGNNEVGDKYADHGTHCACIISAERNNGIGIKGIADNVIIMPVRAVNTLHYGDEMDKDIALAIRYAVDNGARIISMSFGKDLSPQKEWVDEAIKYADKKGVLMVHCAGNDSKNVDTSAYFPSPVYLDGSGSAKNFINVGSISRDTGLALTSGFSNYGQKSVDLFAPGSLIYSCIPGNKYGFKSGTSMAAPEVAGVAALLLEYYPKLTAVQVKDIILRSVTPLKGKMVYKPGTKEKVDFATLSVTGGVLNAYNALQLAAKVSGAKE